MDPANAELIKAAREARERAFAPYSNFKVGAALRTAAGGLVTGANVESASYGLSNCAERVAIQKAVSDGVTGLTHLAVVADSDRLTAPCGACRQVIWEFCGDIPVTLADLNGNSETYQMSELLPHGFDASYLKQK